MQADLKLVARPGPFEAFEDPHRGFRRLRLVVPVKQNDIGGHVCVIDRVRWQDDPQIIGHRAQERVRGGGTHYAVHRSHVRDADSDDLKRLPGGEKIPQVKGERTPVVSARRHVDAVVLVLDGQHQS